MLYAISLKQTGKIQLGDSLAPFPNTTKVGVFHIFTAKKIYFSTTSLPLMCFVQEIRIYSTTLKTYIILDFLSLFLKIKR
jgi:hypothetical protein